MKKYIYIMIAVAFGCLNANIIRWPSHNMAIDIIGVAALIGAVVFMTMCTCTIIEESYEAAMREYIDKVTDEISTLEVENEILKQRLKKKEIIDERK